MRILALLIVIVLCLSVIACASEQTPTAGSAEKEDARSVRSNEAATQANNSLDQMSLTDLLRLIPLPADGGHWESVYLNDYKRMREAHGIQAPEKNATGADLEEYLSRVYEDTGTAGPWFSGYHPSTRELLEVKGYLRFDISNLDQSIWAEDLPRTLEAMTGRFEPGGRWPVDR